MTELISYIEWSISFFAGGLTFLFVEKQIRNSKKPKLEKVE